MENAHQKLQFKTNIKCEGCIAKVTPFLNAAQGIAHWSVDTADKDKILTVETNGAAEQTVVEQVQAAGFRIEALPQE